MLQHRMKEVHILHNSGCIQMVFFLKFRKLLYFNVPGVRNNLVIKTKDRAVCFQLAHDTALFSIA